VTAPPAALGADATLKQAPPAALVVCGASGDLTARKLLPALASLARRGELGERFALIGTARTQMDDERFRLLVRNAVPPPAGGFAWGRVVSGARYVTGNYDDPATYRDLASVLDDADRHAGTAGNRLYYLALVPAMFPAVLEGLGSIRKKPGGFRRVVVEKPFGHNGASAQSLDAVCHAHFAEDEVYRIDHYLGKETVQNVLALRFANAVFEPIWNRRYVDHVQITVAETLGVDHRAGFYEQAGALRDIVQNHVMQVLALTAMEPPTHITVEGIRNEKVKALAAVDTLAAAEIGARVVRAQYRAGVTADEGEVPGYCQEEGVAPDSQVETYVAAKFTVDNWRWAGVPFYVRTGKRLAKRVTEVAMRFHTVPHLPFAAAEARGLEPNSLILRIQPDEGISLEFGAKVPGQGFNVSSVAMNFSYAEAFETQVHDGYERLLIDALVGDPTLFIRTDEVAESWRVCDPILEAWSSGGPPLFSYAAGTWGPAEAAGLLERDGRLWRRL